MPRAQYPISQPAQSARAKFQHMGAGDLSHRDYKERQASIVMY